MTTSISGKRVVLIVEDDRLVANALERQARRAGFEVAIDATGGSAVAMTRALKPVCVVLDMGLPEADGRDVLAALKRTPETAGVPVVMLSGNEDQFSRLTCLELGARDYECKPPSPMMFERLARQLIA